jgi:PAS domain S-box-containing protein
VPTHSDRGSEERQLALLVSSALDYAIVMVDADGCILTWNPGAQRLYGYTHDEIAGTHFSIFSTEQDKARDHAADQLAIALREGRRVEEGWRIRKDGSRFWASVAITPMYDETGAHLGFGEVSRDLSARRRAEEQMRERTLQLEAANAQLEEYRRLVSTIRDYAIFMLDTSGCITSWSAGAQRLKGYTPDEAIGRHFSIFYSQEDRDRDHPAAELAMATRDGSYEEEGWRIRKDGTRFWASVTITAIHDEEGALTGFAKVTRDLTARRETEQALQGVVQELREANAELDRFAAVAAHDLTDPLRTISGFAEVLERRDLSPVERGYVSHIKASSLRLTRMLRDLLTFARAGQSPAAVEPVRLTVAAGHVLEDLQGPIADRGARVTVEIPPGATVLASPGDVRLLLQNLVSNAVKFADADAPEVTVAAQERDGTWRVSVRDNGAGVPEEDRERIFHAFQRAQAGARRAGYGLGLAICQRIVERYGGDLGVEPAEPRGSCFWFALPAREGAVELVR